MPSGETHDRLTLITMPILMLIAEQLFEQAPPAIGALGMSIGSIWFSPDLDHDANVDPYKAWGPIKKIWNPYKRWVPHRSVISHSPILGTAIRLLYLLWIPAVIVAVLAWRQVIPPQELLNILNEIWVPAATFVVGMELAAEVHIFADWVT
jgi:uncharacterized metal-binding protein